MYPNEPCPECNDQENDLPAPPNCGSVCAEVYDALCVNYTGVSKLCETTPILTPGMSVNTALYILADLICDGVSGIAATITIGDIEVVSVTHTTPPSVNISNTGNITDAIFNFSFEIPQGNPADPTNTTASSTDNESITIASKVFTFTTPLVGPYIWNNGTRLRIFYDANNYMEGVVTAHTANDVTVNVTYYQGSGSYSSWTIGLAGDVGSQGDAGTIAVTSPFNVTNVAWNDPAIMTVVNNGNSTNANFEFSVDLPRAVGIASASINLLGQLVFVRDDGSDFNAGALPLNGVPAGGTAGQVLKKIDGTNYNTQWANENTSGFLPTGGTAGQFLVKTSGVNYAAGWIDPPYLAPPTPSVYAGMPVPYVLVGTEQELRDAIIQFNANSGDVGYNGAIIKLISTITLTQNLSLDFDNIEIHGGDGSSIDVQSGATNYYIEVLSGSPIFKNVVFKNTYEKVSSTPKPHKIVLNINPTIPSVPSSVQFINCMFKDIAMGNTGTGASIILTASSANSELLFDGCSIQSDPEVDGGMPTHTVKLFINSVSAAWQGAVTIKGMKWTRATNKGQGQAPAVLTTNSEISSIYFDFSGTWGTGKSTILNIDMESYAYSTLNSKFGVADVGNVYIMNGMFMYGNDDNATGNSLKPNMYGTFGWSNLGHSHPMDLTDYAP